jgi:hypothetical protein
VLDIYPTPSITTAPIPVTGTAAGMSSANPVLLAGQTGYATDTDVLAIGDGSTAWNSLPKVRPSVDPVLISSSATQTGIGGSPTDITALSGCAFTVGAQPWEVELFIAWIDATVTYAAALAYISTSAGTILNSGAATLEASGCGSCLVKHYISTPGSYNLKAQIQVLSGGGTLNVGAATSTLTSWLTARPM